MIGKSSFTFRKKKQRLDDKTPWLPNCMVFDDVNDGHITRTELCQNSEWQMVKELDEVTNAINKMILNRR